MKETLSDKIYLQAPKSERLPDSLSVKDVKEFIKKLKASPDFDDEDRAFIDKLAGDELI